jgi:TetR/AcrR family transcriptional regulator, biofilm operon repressor
MTTKKDLTKVKIGEAAMRCFEKFGIEKTTLDDIAKAVGLNKATLYYYYKNKEEIFLEVAVSKGKEYITQLQSRTLQKKGGDKRILFYLEERVNYYRNILGVSHASAETINRMLPRYFELYEDMLQKEVLFIAQVLKEGVEKEEFVKVDTNKLARHLINMTDALKHNVEHKAMLKMEKEVDYTEAFQELSFLVSLILKAIKK